MSTRSNLARLAVGLAVIIPAGIGAIATQTAGAAPAAAGTSCSSNTGTTTLTPGISNTPAAQKAVLKGSVSGCSGTVKSGKLVATVQGKSKVDCATLSKSSTAKGTITITWNTKAKSTGTVTIVNSSTAKVTGTVTGGLFKGGKITMTLTPTGVTGNCTTTPITQETYSGTFAIS